MTRKAFENAITVVMALGGSTNAVLHLLAMAHAVDVPLTLDDFQAISDNTPFIADLKPSGKYVMEDVHKVPCPPLPCPALPCPPASGPSPDPVMLPSCAADSSPLLLCIYAWSSEKQDLHPGLAYAIRVAARHLSYVC